MIAVGSDHAAFQLKKAILEHLEKNGVPCVDCGTYTLESCDYPVYAKEVCGKVLSGECDLGILVCGTGIGMSIVANKHKGIRAAVCGDTFSAKFTRKHNDANVLCIGERVTGTGLALEIVDTFLANDFEGGRHQRRVDMYE
ncbi:MAG: ribose 5-phosphate isomerase B [Ruminococcaceae bacterium]|nr:ribose 5-phosphate isomerase B [Oscillospiraceae bacterium]